MTTQEILDLLSRLEDYMDDRADVVDDGLPQSTRGLIDGNVPPQLTGTKEKQPIVDR